METCNITLRTKISAACAKETSRYAINGYCAIAAPTEADPNAGFVYATDGRMLAIAPAEVAGKPITPPMPDGSPTFGIIPGETGGRVGNLVTLNGTIQCRTPGRAGKTTVHDPVEGSFPPVSDVLPKPDAETRWIGISADLLRKLADAIDAGQDGKGWVALGIKAPNKPMCVMSLDGSSSEGTLGEGFGVLMPIYTGNTDESLSAEYRARTDRFTAAHDAAKA